MSKINMALELIDDGEWHEIVGLQQKIELNPFDMQKVLAFLEKHGFVSIDGDYHKVRVNEDFQKLDA